MEENKQEILDAFFAVLRMCKDATRLESFEYDERQKNVFVIFKKRRVEVVDVKNDSGLEMIMKILELVKGGKQ